MRSRVEGATGTRGSLAMAAWSIAVVAAGFVEAIVRLGGRALGTVAGGLGALEWAGLAVVVALFGYVEGYRALDRRFAPALVARALAPRPDGNPIVAVLLAPLRALALVGSDRAAVVRAWRGVALIAGAVLAVHALPPRWRGIVDGGVAVALSWGLFAIGWRFAAALARAPRAR